MESSYENLAKKIKEHILKISHRARSPHVGSSLSIADILAVLYGGILHVDPKQPEWSERDRFILSKGHACTALYAVLAERGFLPKSWLEMYKDDGSYLPRHATHNIPGIEASTGSLGHGLSIGCGMALAAKSAGHNYRVFVLLSDGECDEGATWEAALFASHRRLDNLVAIIDYNKLQAFGKVKEVLNLDPLLEKWKAFGWEGKEIDGHDLRQVEDALIHIPLSYRQPTCIVAHTIKGKGVSFMENRLEWHYWPPDDKQLNQALAELGVTE